MTVDFRFVSFRTVPYRFVPFHLVHNVPSSIVRQCEAPPTEHHTDAFCIKKMLRRARRALLLLVLLRRRRARVRRSRSRRSTWVRSIFRRRRQQGEYHNLLQEVRLSDPESHFRCLRMSKETFDKLLEMVKGVNFLFQCI